MKNLVRDQNERLVLMDGKNQNFCPFLAPLAVQSNSNLKGVDFIFHPCNSGCAHFHINDTGDKLVKVVKLTCGGGEVIFTNVLLEGAEITPRIIS